MRASQKNTYQIIAHRGASSEAPENTLSAISRAISLGVNWVEVDLRLTQDKIPILLHDPMINRTTSSHDYCNILIEKLDFDQIRECDFGSWFSPIFHKEPLPSLVSVLSLDFKDTGLMLEIKEGSHSPGEIVKALLKVLLEKKPHPRLVVGSFSLEILKEFEKQVTGFETIAIAEDVQSIITFLKQGYRKFAIWYPLLTTELLNLLAPYHVKIWAFTLDDPELAKSLLEFSSIEGIITNDPRSFLPLITIN